MKYFLSALLFIMLLAPSLAQAECVQQYAHVCSKSASECAAEKALLDKLYACPVAAPVETASLTNGEKWLISSGIGLGGGGIAATGDILGQMHRNRGAAEKSINTGEVVGVTAATAVGTTLLTRLIWWLADD